MRKKVTEIHKQAKNPHCDREIYQDHNHLSTIFGCGKLMNT